MGRKAGKGSEERRQVKTTVSEASGTWYKTKGWAL